MEMELENYDTKHEMEKQTKPEFTTFIELISTVGSTEANYKQLKFEYETARNNLLLNTDWNGINEDRKEQGLPKLSNQDMKNAFIDEKLHTLKAELLAFERNYLDLKRKYEVALKYSFEILKVQI